MHLVNSAFDLLVTMFLCIILLVSLETLIKIILIHFVLFFLSSKSGSSCILIGITPLDLRLCLWEEMGLVWPV